MICLGCGLGNMDKLFSLGDLPRVNAFVKPGEADPRFPLDMVMCRDCGLVQVAEVLDPAQLFTDYLHLSAASLGNLRHLSAVADLLADRFDLHQKRVLEIGCNDGSLLFEMNKRGALAFGVDPARNLAFARAERGLDSRTDFFDADLARAMKSEGRSYDLIVALNVIAHTPVFMSVLNGVRLLLEDHGHFVMENAYVLETLLRGQFDTLYHEHVFCFSLHALQNAYARAGLQAVDAELLPTQGGSIRVVVQKAGVARPPSARLLGILAEERAKGWDHPATLQAIAPRIEGFRRDFLQAFRRLPAGPVIGLGAPARGVVILNYLGLGPDDLRFVIDDTTLKHNRLVPGARIPVRGWDAVHEERDPSFVILSWNYAHDLMARLRRDGLGGRVLIPFPEIRELQI